MPLLHPVKEINFLSLKVIFQAMQIVDIERPNDPISFIAFYMLKNKDRVKIPMPNN